MGIRLEDLSSTAFAKVSNQLHNSGISTPKIRKKPSHGEENLQMLCVEWFDRTFPDIKNLLIHVPNGGSRSSKVNRAGKRVSPEAWRLQRMGVRPGVFDLFLAMPIRQNAFPGFFKCGLWLEAKFGDNQKTANQRHFGAMVSVLGYDEVEFRTFEEFQSAILNYFASAKWRTNP